MDYINMSVNQTKHRWIYSDIPGYFICRCGATGIYNRELEKIEVLEPMPEDVYERRH